MGIIFASDGVPRTISLWLKIRIFFSNPLAVIGTAFLLMGGPFSFVFILIQLYTQTGLPFWICLLVLIFPLVGLIFVLISWQKARRYIHLLRHGMLTTGKITKREATNVRINNRRVYKVYFEFKAYDKTVREAFVKTHIPERLLDETEEALVYDAENPSSAVLLDVLPSAAKRLLMGMSGD